MNILLAAFTFAAGLLNSVQSGTNATLGRSIEPVLAGLFSVLSTAVLLALYGAITGRLSCRASPTRGRHRGGRGPVACSAPS